MAMISTGRANKKEQGSHYKPHIDDMSNSFVRFQHECNGSVDNDFST